jgi:protein SCO1/2
VAFEPRLGATLPLDLTFRDEAGRPVRLGDRFGDRPVVLTLNYYHCPNLCPLALDDLARALAAAPFELGRDFSVVTVSIDPAETPAQAAARKRAALRSYADARALAPRPEPAAGERLSAWEEGWRFLTGDAAAIARLADGVGFRYRSDAAQAQFAHPVGLVVLTPTGRISSYLYGLDFAPHDLRLALVDAGRGAIGGPLDRVALLCYRYDPATGRYSLIALNAVRAGGALTVVGLGAFLAVLWRRDLRRGPRSEE